MIYTITLNPAIDKTVTIDGLILGAVNRISDMRIDAGGKGINVSKVIKALGGESIAMGIVGGVNGNLIEAKLKELGIETDFVKTTAETRVNLKIIDTDDNVNTDINETGFNVTADQLKEVEQKLCARLKSGDIVVIAGSLPKGAPVDTYSKLIRLCNSYEAITVFDADGAVLKEGLKAKPHVIKPNVHELSRLYMKPVKTATDAALYAKMLVRDGISHVIVSLGKDGALFANEGGIYKAPGLKVAVRSTVGAGDSMVAAVCYSMERGDSLGELISLAVATSAANVTCSGTQAAEGSLIKSLKNKVTWERL